MKKILLIDNTFDPPHGSPEIQEQLQRAAKSFGCIDITMVRAPEGGVPDSVAGFDGAVLSGSKTRIDESAPWIDREIKAIRELYALKIPTFGICYGEQLIAKALGGADFTGTARQPEHGWAEMEVKTDSPLLKGLPDRFFSFQFHSDEVRKLPANFRLTATNGACAVQAYDVLDAPIWGVQFHPERGLDLGNKALDRRLAQDPAFPALNRDRAEKIYDPEVGHTIFRNFLAQVWSGRP